MANKGKVVWKMGIKTSYFITDSIPYCFILLFILYSYLLQSVLGFTTRIGKEYHFFAGIGIFYLL